MTKSEFVDKIERGSDIMFDVYDKHYTILTWCDDGIGIDEQHPNEKGMQYFETTSELVEKFLINNIPIGELINKIIITDYS